MSAFVFFIDLVARLHLPNKLTINANQTACLELDAHALELLARAFGVAVEHAASVEFVAPGERGTIFTLAGSWKLGGAALPALIVHSSKAASASRWRSESLRVVVERVCSTFPPVGRRGC